MKTENLVKNSFLYVSTNRIYDLQTEYVNYVFTTNSVVCELKVCKLTMLFACDTPFIWNKAGKTKTNKLSLLKM